MGIKLLIFDFGDVIGHFDINHFNKFIHLNGGDSNKVGEYFKIHKSDFDKNMISEKDFWTKLSEFVDLKLNWEIIVENNKKNLMIDYKLLNLIKKINVEKIILSNMDFTTVSQIKKELNLNEFFSDIFFSCELGKNKLDDSILYMICKKYDVLPNEVLFIDDFQGNIDRASKFGFNTHLFTSIKDLETKF